MKKILVLVLSFILIINVNAQKQTVDISKLSPELQAQIQEEQKTVEITEGLKQYGEWAGMGKEIGVAVKEGLSALTSEVENVSKTDAGKLTMFIIAWKVIGDDAKGLIFGPIIMIFITLIYLYLFKKWYGVKKIKIKSEVSEGLLWNKKIISPAEYEIINPNDNDDDSFITGKVISASVYAIFMIVLIVIIL